MSLPRDKLGLARTCGFSLQRWNSRSGRLFLGCARGRRKKRCILTFSSRSAAVSLCATRYEEFALSQRFLRPYSSRNLDVARRIYNYRLTRARRMLECAFVIVCNKLRIFHCAIDICPDFCDVIFKTCCILHNFVCQRDGFQFQDTWYECPLESNKVIGNGGNGTGTDMWWRARGTGMSLRWGAWQGIVYRGLVCRRRVWRRAPL
jgi:hypothetical protein